MSHLPPGTSKWNNFEHRLFSQITLNWRGKPLTTLEAVVSLVAAPRTTTGLKVKAVAALGPAPGRVVDRARGLRSHARAALAATTVTLRVTQQAYTDSP